MKDLFFDLDHTLWDFEKNSREALKEGYDLYSLNTKGIGDVSEYVFHYEKANTWCWGEYQAGRMEKNELRWRRFSMALEYCGLDVNSDPEVKMLGEKLGKHYVETSPFMTHLVKDALEVVKELKNRGHRLIILTNGFEEVQHIKVNRCGLEPFFEKVLTSDALGIKKPNPGIFKLALHIVGSRVQDAVMLGDSLESDVMGARDSGWGQVYYNPMGIPHNEAVLHEVKDLKSILEIKLNK
ncbi:MAG: noncanonical pyrimidine nucleotidase, YjjG family [Bacteroidetes bacterium]|nr:MAG: noncanonical pyrimidine nucleotidase, YjjG family [Bacteroidota bacterium]